MYSGHNLLYAFKLTLNDIKEIFDIDEEFSQYNISDYLEILFSSKNIDLLQFLFLPCCYFTDDCVFLGIDLGSIETQYRSQICKYNNFQDYYSKYLEILENIKEKYIEILNKIENDVNNLFHNFPKVKDFLNKDEIKFYTIPNDCESCT